MNLFSISQLEQFSGIKAHTIRIWEQRYKALSPQRSEGNTRYYDGTQLKKLLNIVTLVNEGYKISKVCQLSDAEIEHLLIKDDNAKPERPNTDEYFIGQMIASSLSFDEVYFEKILSQCLLHKGFKNTYIHIFIPMLHRLGLMWLNGTISASHEHFISHLIKQKINVSIDALHPSVSSDSWLLLLPEHEFHDIPLLFANYILRLHGKRVYYMGANFAHVDIDATIQHLKPNHILFFLVRHQNPKQLELFINSLVKKNNKSKIYTSGNPVVMKGFKQYKKITFLTCVQDLEKIILSQ